MDYSYFINSADKYSAKKLPTPKSSCIKFKDVTDLYDLREDIKDYKPTTSDNFEEIYENCFDSIYSYDIEVDTFEDAILANRHSFLGANSWIKKHWHELLGMIEGFDTGNIEINDDWFITDDGLAKVLLKSGFAEQKSDLEYDDWSNSLQGNKLSELKEIAKPLGIKLSQRKDALIHELVTYEESNTGTLPSPTLIRLLPQLETVLLELEERYISDLSNSLDDFEYPRLFEATIWNDISTEHDGLIKTLADEKLNEFKDLFEKAEQDLLAADQIIKDLENDLSYSINSNDIQDTDDYLDEEVTKTLDNSVVLIFDYEDSKGEVSNREFRLDKLNEKDGITYLKGICYVRNASRTFRLDRIQGKVILKETGELVDKNHIRDFADFKPRNTKKKTRNSTPKTSNNLHSSSSKQEDSINTNATGWIVAGWIFGVLAIITAISGLVDGNILLMIMWGIPGISVLPVTNKLIAEKMKTNGLISNFSIAKGFILLPIFIIIGSMFIEK